MQLPVVDTKELAAIFANVVTTPSPHADDWVARNGDESLFSVLHRILPSVSIILLQIYSIEIHWVTHCIMLDWELNVIFPTIVFNLYFIRYATKVQDDILSKEKLLDPSLTRYFSQIASSFAQDREKKVLPGW